MENFEIYPVSDTSGDMFPRQISLAMLYVPEQRWERLYPEEDALEKGTLFRGLDFPFYGGADRR